jgi:hypothetical protein
VYNQGLKADRRRRLALRGMSVDIADIEDVDDNEPPYRLYAGATFANRFEGMFSFFPCLPAEEGNGFARPRIRLPKVINGRKNQGTKITPQASVNCIREVWRAVTNQVLLQGLHLGVYADMPRTVCT